MWTTLGNTPHRLVRPVLVVEAFATALLLLSLILWGLLAALGDEQGAAAAALAAVTIGIVLGLLQILLVHLLALSPDRVKMDSESQV